MYCTYLESVHNVGKVQVRVALIHQLVEHLKRLNSRVNILPKSESVLQCKNAIIAQYRRTLGMNIEPCLHHSGLEVVELEPLLVFAPDELDGLVGVHLSVGPLHPLPDLILLVIITKCLFVFQSLLRSQELRCVK